MKALCDIAKSLFPELLGPTHFNIMSKISKGCSVLNPGWLTDRLQAYCLLSPILGHNVSTFVFCFRSLKGKAQLGFR